MGYPPAQIAKLEEIQSLELPAIMEANLTIRRRYVGDIGIMCRQSGPEIDARGATDGDGAVVMLESESIVDKILLNQRLI